MSDSSSDSDSKLGSFIDRVREAAENAYNKRMREGTVSFPCDENGYVLPLFSIDGVNKSPESLMRRRKRLLNNLHQAEDAVYNRETQFLTSLAGIRNGITCFEPSPEQSTSRGRTQQLRGQKEFHVDDAKRLFSWSSFRYQKVGPFAARIKFQHVENAMIAAGLDKGSYTQLHQWLMRRRLLKRRPVNVGISARKDIIYVRGE
ncbi:hypothetical protein M513_08065 [Trichuris suis]|uniref:Chromatin modification-related protein MEAF6 n=1 Tax=Trichuris suis TaxID=68888 RepID=A0A085M1C8_9BILA|nr:hypothetical protein M513_08065 [Trichuris suis]